MATAVDRELAAAREPIPVRRSEDSISKGLVSAVAQQRKERSHSTASGNGKGWNPPIISLDGIQTWLKLRTKVVLSKQQGLTADLGLDLNPQGRQIRPVAALSYPLKSKDVEWSTLRLTPQRAVLVKSFPVNLDRVKLPVRFTLNTAAGLSYQGRPDFDINVGDLKPNWLVGVAAVTMLALRQPLTGVKTFGDTEFKQPTAGLALLEAKVKAQRGDSGLSLGLGQLNAIIRV